MPHLVLDEPETLTVQEVKKPRLVLDEEPVSAPKKPRLVLDTDNPLPEIVSKESVPFTSPEIKRPIPEIKALTPEVEKNLVKPEGKTQKAETPLAKVIEATVGDKGWDVVRNYLSKFPREELKATYGTDKIEDIVNDQRHKAKKGVSRLQGAAQGALGITPGHPELKQGFPADSTVSQVIGGVLPYLIPAGGTVAKFTAIPAAQEAVRQVTDRQEQLTPEQRMAKVGTVAAGGAVTGKIFKDADLGKTVFNRILQRSAGAGAASITENIVQDAISGHDPDAKAALVNGGINAASIGILGAMVEIPQLRGSVMAEGRRLAGKPVSYDEALKVVKKAQINPEELSPSFQTALYDQNRKAFIKKLKEDYGEVNYVVLDVQKARGKLQRAQIFDSVGAKEAARSRAAGADPSKGMYAELLPYRDQIINGADPIDILMAKRLADSLRPKTQIEQTIPASEAGKGDILTKARVPVAAGAPAPLKDDIPMGIKKINTQAEASIQPGNRGAVPNVGTNVHLYKEARKYKTAEEFAGSLYSEGLRNAANLKRDRISPDNGGFYYHVVPDYDGGPIVSAAKRGIPVEEIQNKWPDFEGYGSSYDYQNVSLYNNLSEAHAFNKDFLKGAGKILRIKLNKDTRISPNEEGYASVQEVSKNEIKGEVPQLTDIWNKAHSSEDGSGTQGIYNPSIQEYHSKRNNLYKKFYGEAKSAKYSNLGAERIAEKKTAEALKAGAWGVLMPKEPSTRKKVNKTEILSYAEKAFNVPIRGRATHRFKNLAGLYNRKEQIVRLRKWGELEPMTHEIAHHIDAQMKKDLGKHWKSGSASGKQRADLYKELGKLDYEPYKARISEGFAEYMRHYLTAGQAEKRAPLFHRFFTEVFLKSNPDIAKKIATLKDMIDTWQGQGAENRILAQIDFKKEHTDILGLRAKTQKAYEWFNRNFIDEFYTLRKIEEQMSIKPGVNIRPTEDPFTMATYAKSKAGLIARTFVMEKAIDEYGRVVGPGLQEILAPISSDEIQPFIAYGVARRALNYQERGIESGIDIEDAKFIIDKYSGKEDWDSVLEGITDWSNHLLDWVVRAGGLGQKEATIIRELNLIYLPFMRAFVDEVGVFRGSGSSMVNRGQSVKSRKGNARPIINPIESLVAQASEMILKAQKINIARLIADLARKEGVGGFIAKVPAPMTAQSFTLEKLKSQLEDMGVDLSDANLEEIMTVFSQGQQYRGKDNIVSIFRDGKREFYELHPDLYRALSGLDMLDRGILLKIFSPFSRMLRLGATGLKLSFNLVRNPWRDALSYVVLSKHKTAIPLLDSAKGVITEITAKPGDLAWRFKNTGGSLSGMMGFDRAATMAIYDDLVNQKLKARQKVIKAVNPKNVPALLSYLVNQAREGLNVFELGPRVAELEKSYKKYLKEHPEWTEEDAFVAAFNDAQDVTVNFTKSGYMGKRINEVTAFFNASVQGANKMTRAIKGDPVGFFAKGVAWLTVLALMNWYRIKDKQWYKNLPPDYRYSNFFFEIDENTILRLPMPFEVGTLFVSVPMAAMDVWETEDPKYIDSIKKIIEGQIQRPWNISMTAPVIQALENKNYFGSPIESRTLENLPIGERKTYNTSQLAVSLAGAVNGIKRDTISPVKMEYLLNQYTGGALRQIPQADIKETSDMPVLSDLLVHAPEKPQRQLGEFYVDFERLKYQKTTDTLKGGDVYKYYRLNAANAMFSALRKRAVEYDKRGDVEGIRSVYKKMEKILSKVGYE